MVPLLALSGAAACTLVAERTADAAQKTGDAAAAESLFYEARALMKLNNFAAACPKLEESLRLSPGLGTEFNLADCNEHLGKTATAWQGFLSVATGSRAANQPQREKVAQSRAKAIEARVPRLVITVLEPPAGLEIRRDDVVVGAASWGSPIPIDPGTHRITATAPGKARWEATIQATQGAIARVTLPRDMNAIASTYDPATPEVASTETTAAPLSTGPSYFPPAIVERDGTMQRTVGWLLGGAGVVSLGAAAIFGLRSASKGDDSNDHCSGDICDSTGVQLRDDAITAGNIATGLTIGGAAALAGGIILLVTAPSSDASRATAIAKSSLNRPHGIRFVPNIATNGGGFGVQGVLP